MRRFRQFLRETEEEEGVVKIPARIPLDDEIFLLKQLFAKYHRDLRVVGGAVRDFLYHQKFGKPGEKFKAKDYDLVTDATPKEIKAILKSNEAEEMNIRFLGVGAQFGIIVAQIPRYLPDGKTELKEYEIASYRTDSKTGDGRRPDSVAYTPNPREDANRRDLTFNALYYNIPDSPDGDGQVIDYNNGQGLHDIERGIARPVGPAAERFTEDNLRVMRLIRFFARYNAGSPEEIERNDPATGLALRQFAAMPSVSNERLAAEFLSGLKSAQEPVNYLKALHYYGIINRAFPGLNVTGGGRDKSDVLGKIRQLGKNMQRNPRLILAFLLKDNDPEAVAQVLSGLTYTVKGGEGEQRKLVPHVKFLLELLNFAPERVYKMAITRDKLRPDVRQGEVTPEEFNHYVQQHNDELIAWASLNRLDLNMISNFVNFERSVNAYDPRLAGRQGPELGRGIEELERRNFLAMTKKT